MANIFSHPGSLLHHAADRQTPNTAGLIFQDTLGISEAFRTHATSGLLHHLTVRPNIFIHIIINLADCPGGKPANTPAAPSPIAIPKNNRPHGLSQ